jgi:hypothetical protein
LGSNDRQDSYINEWAAVQKFANPSKISNAKVICEAEVWVLRANLKWKLVARLVGSCLVLLLMLGVTSCEQVLPATDISIDRSTALTVTDGPLAEVNTPASISKLAVRLDKYQPQVEILSPKADEVLVDDRVTVKFKVAGFPLFKQPELGLGNHLHVILDKQTYQGVYDLSQPLVFKNLAPGTHSLRVFASRPWHESFKNEGAFDRVTFHVLTKTAENNPDPQQPLLTYSRPAGTYGAEPIMLDYYLTNAPSHPVTPGSPERLADWRVRVTINDQRFILDRWAPVYLQGFKPGKNWVKMELVDDGGHPLLNVYNDPVGIVTYDPQLKDSLAKLIQGELSPTLMQGVVDPNSAKLPTTPIPTIAPAPVSTPALIPQPVLPTPPMAQSSPSPVLVPAPISKPIPSPPAAVPEIVKILPSPEPRPAQNEATPPTPIASPTPSSNPIVIVPVPVVEPKQPLVVVMPTPVPTPAPKIAKNFPQPAPVQVLIPTPSTSQTPMTPQISATPPSLPPEIAIVPPQTPVAAVPKPIAPQPISSPAPILVTPPAIPTPQPHSKQPPTPPDPATTGEKTWQAQTIELVEAAKVKIRAFTNTIPAKSQRFARNLQVWAGQAIEFIDSLRDSPKERLRQRG